MNYCLGIKQFIIWGLCSNKCSICGGHVRMPRNSAKLLFFVMQARLYDACAVVTIMNASNHLTSSRPKSCYMQVLYHDPYTTHVKRLCQVNCWLWFLISIHCKMTIKMLKLWNCEGWINELLNNNAITCTF